MIVRTTAYLKAMMEAYGKTVTGLGPGHRIVYGSSGCAFLSYSLVKVMLAKSSIAKKVRVQRSGIDTIKYHT